MENKKVAVFRKEHFCAAHRLHNDAWDEQKNFAVFGKCNNPNYHGHNYELIVKLIGIPDKDTGFVADLKKLGELIREKVIRRFDHKNLNLDVEEFREKNPTVENITIVIYNLLKDYIEPDRELVVRLYETEKNFAEYPA
ncbi:MAG: 6-carboxytetrahydropterin synthase [Chitinophagaceae bacterium]|nr:6-carboxytetrahydropterin synthase [Chitinophagaceae bacterium]